MSAFLLVLVILIILVGLTRRWLLYRPVAAPTSEPFDGVIYQVGQAAVAERRSPAPEVTVIGVPGYCENARYFTAHYADPRIQLIILISADYHPGLDCQSLAAAPWADLPSVAAGSVEYDAQVLCQALSQLPKTGHIRIHGHSRGGAVILEAGALRPDLFQGVDVILETPVLPQAQLIKRLSPFFYWLMPFGAPIWRRWPISPFLSGRWGTLQDPRKRELIESMPFNARRTKTLVTNLRSIERWIQTRTVALYSPIESGLVLIADDDQVLDPAAMLASARRAGAGLRVSRVSQASHFLLLDRPDAVPPLPLQAAGDGQPGNGAASYGEV